MFLTFDVCYSMCIMDSWHAFLSSSSASHVAMHAHDWTHSQLSHAWVFCNDTAPEKCAPPNACWLFIVFVTKTCVWCLKCAQCLCKNDWCLTQVCVNLTCDSSFTPLQRVVFVCTFLSSKFVLDLFFEWLLALMKERLDKGFYTTADKYVECLSWMCVLVVVATTR